MKGKKGLDYIDWSISMGIFIVAVTALFVFLKPGARPEHDQDTLMNIVEQQFIKETQWFVHETPLFIQHLQPLYGPGNQVEIKVEADDIRFTAVPQLPTGLSMTGLPTDTLRFNCQAIDCGGSRLKLFGTTNNPSENTQMEVTCTPSNELTVCKAVLGATITYQGLQQSKIAALRARQPQYEAIKSSWNYPLQKEFAIYQDNNKIIGSQEPAQGSNIFVKELKMNRIDDQGIQTAITINIRVW